MSWSLHSAVSRRRDSVLLCPCGDGWVCFPYEAPFSSESGTHPISTPTAFALFLHVVVMPLPTVADTAWHADTRTLEVRRGGEQELNEQAQASCPSSQDGVKTGKQGASCFSGQSNLAEARTSGLMIRPISEGSPQ